VIDYDLIGVEATPVRQGESLPQCPIIRISSPRRVTTPSERARRLHGAITHVDGAKVDALPQRPARWDQ
jgi:hypothetical protein